jgi:hypothetical protein
MKAKVGVPRQPFNYPFLALCKIQLTEADRGDACVRVWLSSYVWQ